MSATVWTVDENATTWLDGFDRSALPYQASHVIRVVVDGARSGLEIGGVVGTIPLTDGTFLRVRPKVGDFNFVRMMLRADGLFSDLKPEFDDLAAYGADDTATPVWIVCRALCRALAEISRQSLSFRRTREHARGMFVGGRLLPLPTATRLACRSEDPIVFSRMRRDYDTPEHRVLGKASDVALRFLRPGEDARDVASAETWSRQYGLRFSIGDLAHVARQLMAQRYGGSRGYYARALALARILLGDAGYATDGASTSATGEGFLVDTAQLFERYIRAVLIESHKAAGIVLTKGGGIRRESLYLDGSFELEPDYVYQHNMTIRLIADAKYKRPDSGDHYQMACYLTRYGVSSGVFFFPEHEGRSKDSIRRTTPDGITVFEVPLPLSDLDATERIISTSLERFGRH